MSLLAAGEVERTADHEGEEKGAAAMAGRAPARDKTSFAAACSLLSQYIKDNKGGLQGLGGLAMAPAADSPIAAGAAAFRPPTTMNLLSALDAPADEPSDAAKATVGEPNDHDKRNGGNPREAAGDEAQQLTIFYGGKVVVFDKFPSTKVKDLLQIVNPGGDGVDRAAAAPQNLPTPSHNSLSDVPIARRNSLQRFLEKRKDRISAKAPYQVNTVGVEASKQAAGVEEKPWLGLGQEATIKQEM